MAKIFRPAAVKLFAGLLIFFQLCQILYFERSFFLENYDHSYWQDRFEHSQWRLPLSERIVGDDGLYRFVGYQLVRGAGPDLVNAETPPLGKYLIGWSIKIFRSPAHYALILGLGSLFLFYLLGRRLLSGGVALFLAAVLFLEPFFFTNLWKAWLDIGQLFFLLANLFFLPISPLLAGACLGFFAVSKAPLLLPLVLGLETIYFLVQRRGRRYALFLLGVFVAVWLVYRPYFSLGHSWADFLRLQKYMIGFYQQSRLQAHWRGVWQVLLAGKFPAVSSGITGPVAEWSFWWPVLAMVGIVAAFKNLWAKKGLLIWRGVGALVLLTLLTYTLIPFYPRYLLIIWPFLILLAGQSLKALPEKRRAVLMIAVLLMFGIRAFLFLLPDPDPRLNNFYHNLTQRYFQDIYAEDLARVSRPAVSREEFWRLGLKAMNQATVRAIEVAEQERQIPRFGNKGEVKLRLTYKTLNLGPFVEEKTVKLVKENSLWRVVWDWDILLAGFLPGYQVEAEIRPGRRGTILAADGSAIIQDGPGYLVSVKPGEVSPPQEEEMLKLVARLSGVDKLNLYNAYQENVLPNTLIPLTTLPTIPDGQTLKTLLSYPGLVLTKSPTRVYNGLSPADIQNTFYRERDTRIYSRYSYRGVGGPEKVFDDLLWGYDGGKILMKDGQGKTIRMILEKAPRRGQDVILEE